jgi:hypothetical protein
MAFEILSLTKVEREFDYEPNYRAVIKYNQVEIPCEIRTNAKFMVGGKLICDYLYRTSMNGNLSLKVDTLKFQHREYEKGLERELIDFAKNQNFKNKRN